MSANEAKIPATVEVPEIVDDAAVMPLVIPVSYTHLRAHETVLDLVCRLLLEKKKQPTRHTHSRTTI